MLSWLERNWYLVIPWVLGIGAWLIGRQRRVRHPLWLGIAFFGIGSVIVLALDLVLA